jgi:hypothetical protein
MGLFIGCILVGVLGCAAAVRLAHGKDILPRPTRRRTTLAPSSGATKTAMVALLVGASVLVLTRWPVAGALAGATVFLWPKIAKAGAIERTSVAKIEAIASWTESLRDAAATESALESAIPATLAGAPKFLEQPLRDLINRLAVRVPLPEALTRFADAVDDPGADMVVAALSLNARQRSGSLKRVLTTLAANTRTELEARRKVLHERNSVRRQSQQVALAILVLAAGQAVLAPSWVAPYGTPLGQAVLAVLAGAYLALTLRLQRLSTPEPQPRFLGEADVVTEVSSWRPQGATR